MNTDFLANLKQHPELWNTFVQGIDLFDPELSFQGLHRSNIMTPSVAEYLIKDGYQVSYPHNKKFAICLTHDVDDIHPPFSHLVLSGLASLRKGNLGELIEHAFWPIKGKRASPYLNFHKIMELEKKYNAKSTFYFMATAEDPIRFRYNIEDIAAEVKHIAESGWEVGLHGGYYSYNDYEAIKQEKEELESVLGKKVIGYRNHYLKFQVPDTWAFLERCGFKYDSTYGYSKAVGFRNGMCHPFRPYNLRHKRWMDIYELPLHVMESALFDLVKPQEAWELIKQLLEQVELNQGVLTVLWHNNVFNCPFRESWYLLYEQILQYGKEKQAWMTSGEEIWEWWIENGY